MEKAKSSRPKILHFTYYNEGETIFLQEAPLIKGTPAKILLWMLRTYLATGKSLFFLSEMRTKSDLGSSGNLEARLERLARRMEEREEAVRLVRQRGCRRLECAFPVSLEEV